MGFELYLGCFNEPLRNLSRYDCIYTSSQVYSALYFEMVQLKKKVVNERYSVSEICHQLLKNPFSATHIVVYRVPETFVAHCT
jgi:hypothetical protein